MSTERDRGFHAKIRYVHSLCDPRWQRRRLEVLERDGFACFACGDQDSPLVVHHKRYCGKPWEAGDDDLQTLCETCHGELGNHPKGGVYYSRESVDDVRRLNVAYEHCPLCGEKHHDCHSGCIAFACGHNFGWHSGRNGFLLQWQSLNASGRPVFVLQ